MPPSTQKGGTAPNFWSMFVVAKWLMDQNATWYRGRPRPRPHCVNGDPAPPKKGHKPQFSALVYCGQMVAHLRSSDLALRAYIATTETNKHTDQVDRNPISF